MLVLCCPMPPLPLPQEVRSGIYNPAQCRLLFSQTGNHRCLRTLSCLVKSSARQGLADLIHLLWTLLCIQAYHMRQGDPAGLAMRQMAEAYAYCHAKSMSAPSPRVRKCHATSRAAAHMPSRAYVFPVVAGSADISQPVRCL